MRLFIAIELPPEMRRGLNLLAVELAKAAHSVRPVSSENIHLTLHFLGNVDDADVPRVSDAVGRVAAAHPPCAAKVCAVGSFDRRGAPSVLWAGVEEVDGLMGIQSDLGAELSKADIECDARRFLPHITIARIRSGRRIRRLASLTDAHADRAFGVLPIDSIALVKSTLTPEGPVYETLVKAPLG